MSKMHVKGIKLIIHVDRTKLGNQGQDTWS